MDQPLTAGSDAALERVLASYEAYYTVRREGVPAPFAAEAEFHAHGEKYFLSKLAKYAEIDSHEYVFFAVEPVLTPERVRELSIRAWEEGIARVQPGPNHRATDVLLIILTGDLSREAQKAIRRTRFAKSYLLGFRGYSHFRMAAMEPATLITAHNNMGEGLAKLLSNIFSR